MDMAAVHKLIWLTFGRIGYAFDGYALIGIVPCVYIVVSYIVGLVGLRSLVTESARGHVRCRRKMGEGRSRAWFCANSELPPSYKPVLGRRETAKPCRIKRLDAACGLMVAQIGNALSCPQDHRGARWHI